MMAAEQVGAQVRFLQITQDWQIDTDSLTEQLQENVQLVAIPIISNVT